MLKFTARLPPPFVASRPLITVVPRNGPNPLIESSVAPPFSWCDGSAGDCFEGFTNRQRRNIADFLGTTNHRRFAWSCA